MSVIKAENISCHFGSVKAVNELSFEIPEGSIFGLLGPNGAGKSTTIKTLMGLNKPTKGKGLLLGVDGRKLGPKQLQRIGYVSEDQKMPDWMKVDEVIAYCAPLYPTWDGEFVKELLVQFELPGERRLRTLSRGMRMKVALILAIAFRPEVLILDEPFGGLDPVVREELIDGILELTGQEKWTVLLSSHDMEEVERLADRVGILKGGRLVTDEGVEELQERFRKVEVSFSGEVKGELPMSWLSARMSESRAEFVHSQFSESEWQAEEKMVFGEGALATVSKMNLREIYLTIARKGGVKEG